MAFPKKKEAEKESVPARESKEVPEAALESPAKAVFSRCCLYHKTEAPEGRVFDSQEAVDAQEKRNPGWVDTPAKFASESD